MNIRKNFYLIDSTKFYVTFLAHKPRKEMQVITRTLEGEERTCKTLDFGDSVPDLPFLDAITHSPALISEHTKINNVPWSDMKDNPPTSHKDELFKNVSKL